MRIIPGEFDFVFSEHDTIRLRMILFQNTARVVGFLEEFRLISTQTLSISLTTISDTC